MRTRLHFELAASTAPQNTGRCMLAAAHEEAARQHAAAADAHALAAEMHWEAIHPDEDTDPNQSADAQNASADAATQTETAAEAAAAAGGIMGAMRDASREAETAFQRSDAGEDPREAHAAAAWHHAAEAARHAEAASTAAPGSVEAGETHAWAESAALRARDAAAR